MRFHLQAREQQSYNIFRTSSLTETYLEHQAPAPVGVQRPAHAEVEAGGGVADVQPPQFPLRLKRATAKKRRISITTRSCRCWYTKEKEGRILVSQPAGQAIRTTRRSSPPARCRSCMTTTGRTVRRRNCSGSIWTRHSPCRTQNLSVSSGELEKSTGAGA